MAKGRVSLRCEKCGKEWEEVVIKRTRREVDEWESWAVENYKVCRECYAKSTAGEYSKVVRVSYRDYKNKYSECKSIRDSYNSEDKTISIIMIDYDKLIADIDEVLNSVDKSYDEEKYNNSGILEWINASYGEKKEMSKGMIKRMGGAKEWIEKLREVAKRFNSHEE